MAWSKPASRWSSMDLSSAIRPGSFLAWWSESSCSPPRAKAGCATICARWRFRKSIDAALASTAGLIEAGHFTVECEIEEESAAGGWGCFGAFPMPPESDHQRLEVWRRSNAGSAFEPVPTRMARPVRRSRSASRTGASGSATADLPHIFEPFYRSPSVKAAQIHGTGLGLAPIAEHRGGDERAVGCYQAFRGAGAPLPCTCLARRIGFYNIVTPHLPEPR